MALYTVRDIPPKLHKAWKTMAAQYGVSMRDIVIDALHKHIEELQQNVNSKDGINGSRRGKIS